MFSDESSGESSGANALCYDLRGKIVFVRSGDGDCVRADCERAVSRGDAAGYLLCDKPADAMSHYVRDGVLLRRPTLTPGHEGIPGGFRLWGLPIPCRVHVDELVYDVDDGELEWTTPVSGTHQVRVEAWPYLDWERPVEVKP